MGLTNFHQGAVGDNNGEKEEWKRTAGLGGIVRFRAASGPARSVRTCREDQGAEVLGSTRWVWAQVVQDVVSSWRRAGWAAA